MSNKAVSKKWLIPLTFLMFILAFLFTKSLNSRLAQPKFISIKYPSIECGDDVQTILSKMSDPDEIYLRKSGITIMGFQDVRAGLKKGTCIHVNSYQVLFSTVESGDLIVENGSSKAKVDKVLGRPVRKRDFNSQTIYTYHLLDLNLRIEVIMISVETFRLFGLPVKASQVAGEFRLSLLSTRPPETYF